MASPGDYCRDDGLHGDVQNTAPIAVKVGRRGASIQELRILAPRTSRTCDTPSEIQFLRLGNYVPPRTGKCGAIVGEDFSRRGEP